MEGQHQQILEYLISYWWEQFNMIPAMEVAETFHIPETEALHVLEEMATEGLVELHRHRAGPRDPGMLDRPVSEIFRSTYVLPSRSVLKTHFDETKQDFGCYKNLLYAGVSQDELFRFRPGILDYYQRNPEIEVKDDLIVTTRAALKRDDVRPVYLRYRWATGASGDRYIIVNLWDLAELSHEEQALWAGHGIQELRETGA